MQRVFLQISPGVCKSIGNPHFYEILSEEPGTLLEVFLPLTESSFNPFGLVIHCKVYLREQESLAIACLQELFSFFFPLCSLFLTCATCCAGLSLPVYVTAISFFDVTQRSNTVTHILPTTFLSRFERVKNAQNTFTICLIIFMMFYPHNYMQLPEIALNDLFRKNQVMLCLVIND